MRTLIKPKVCFFLNNEITETLNQNTLEGSLWSLMCEGKDLYNIRGNSVFTYKDTMFLSRRE